MNKYNNDIYANKLHTCSTHQLIYYNYYYSYAQLRKSRNINQYSINNNCRPAGQRQRSK